MTRLSVVTINWNMRDGLSRTIDSVRAQTYAEIQHVIIDGGSTDGSAALLTENPRDQDFYLTERDNGIADAFNKGLKYASGEYVCFMNSGDIFASDVVVTNFFEQVKLRGKGVYYGDFVAVSREGRMSVKTDASPECFEWYNPINHQSAFIPIETCLKYPYDSRLKLGMDYDFWLRILGVEKFHKLDFEIAEFELAGRSCDPRWRVHNYTVRRVLWHVNRGTRIEINDVMRLAWMSLLHLAKNSLKSGLKCLTRR